MFRLCIGLICFLVSSLAIAQTAIVPIAPSSPCNGANQALNWNSGFGCTTISGGGSSNIPAHGSVSLFNTGLQHTLAVGPYNGGGLLLYCAANSQYQMFVVPAPIPVMSVANNGSGAFRVTLATNSRTFHAGERVFINTFSFWMPIHGDWLVNQIDATHIDLIGSTYTSGFPGGAVVLGGVIGNGTSIRINGVAAQASAANVIYSIFLRWADAGCTYAEMSLTTSGSSLPPNGGPAFPIDNIGDGGTLVGIGTKRDIGTGVGATWQGNGQYNLILGWYNRHWQTLFAVIPGQISSTAWTEFGGIANRIGFLTWGDEMGGEATMCLAVDAGVSFVSAQYGYVGIGVNGQKPDGSAGYTVTNGGTNPPSPVISSAWFASINDVNTMCATLPVNNNIGGGWYEYAFYGKWQGPTPNTLRNGVLGTSRVSVRAQF